MKRLSMGLRLTLWYLAIFALVRRGHVVHPAANVNDMVDDDLENQVEDLKSFLSSQRKDASLAKIQEEVTETYGIQHSGDYLALYAEDGQLIYSSAFLRSHPSLLMQPGQVAANAISKPQK